jgi:hypothetical protein
VDDVEELALELEGDPLSEASDPGDATPDAGLQGRLDAPQERGPSQAEAQQLATYESPLEGMNVEEDVWELGHPSYRRGKSTV